MPEIARRLLCGQNLLKIKGNVGVARSKAGFGALKIEMLTPKDEHFVSPCSTRGDVRWENQFRRNRNRQKLCSWILFPNGPQVKKKFRRLPFAR